MNCRPKPVTTCGSLINDTCVVYTGPWPSCFPNQGEDCYRQSEFNEAAGTLICELVESVQTLEASTDLSDLSGCAAFEPVKTTVKAEFQNIYNVLCDYKVDLNTPLNGSIDLKCLQASCPETPITTLKDLLQALVDSHCECCASGQ